MVKTTLPVIVSAASNDGEDSSFRSATPVSRLAATISPAARPSAVIGALTHRNDDPRIALYVNVRALPAANSPGPLRANCDSMPPNPPGSTFTVAAAWPARGLVRAQPQHGPRYLGGGADAPHRRGHDAPPQSLVISSRII